MSRSYAAHAQPLWRRVLLTRESAVIGLLVLVWIWASAAVPNFSGPLTVPFLILDVAPILLIALPMTMVIVTGEIDLSVASVVGLSSVLVGILHQDGLSIPLAGAVALARRGRVRSVQRLPGRLRRPAVARGDDRHAGPVPWPGGRPARHHRGDRLPAEVDQPGAERLRVGRVPYIVVPIVVLAVVFALLLHFTSFGRGVFDVGLNDEAAHFSGVNVARTKLLVFVLTGVVSAFAGIYYTLRYGSARGDNATGLELQVIAAVLLGGVSIFGGRGALHGVLGGVLLIGVISSALRLENVTVNVINIVIGGLLVLSVMYTSFLAWIPRIRRTPGKGRGQVGPRERRVAA